MARGRGVSGSSLSALRGRIGGFALAASHDPSEYTRAGRAAFLARFEREVDPDGELNSAERARRAEAARRAYFARLALASARARQQRRRRRELRTVNPPLTVVPAPEEERWRDAA